MTILTTAALVAGVLIVLLLGVIWLRQRTNRVRTNESLPHTCGAVNSPAARYCRRCGEQLVMFLGFEGED